VYNSDDGPLVSYVLATYNRVNDLEEAIESVLDQDYQPVEIVVISNSTDETGGLFEEGGPFDIDRVHYHHFPERMGVPRARNIGFEHAAGDILVTMDDDAVLASTDAIDEIVSLFAEHEDVGALAFQHRNYYTGEIELNGTPDPPPGMSPDQSYRATNFVGVGNAIRRSTLEVAGTYPDRFVYGFEEMDLSLRIHDTGYDILYTPTVVVRHKESPKARRPGIEVQERLVENRIRIAIRNLPWRYVLFTTLIWSVYALLLTKDPSSLSRISRRLYGNRRDLLGERNVVDARTITRIKSRETMLYLWWYGPHPRRILGSDGDLHRLLWET
jgi:GT2 family glycosyltransferase